MLGSKLNYAGKRGPWNNGISRHDIFFGFILGYLSTCMSVVNCSLCVIHLATYHKPGAERGCDYCVLSPIFFGKDDELLYRPPTVALGMSVALDVSYISNFKPLTCLLLFYAGSFYRHISRLLHPHRRNQRKYRIPWNIFSICWIVEWKHWTYFHLISTKVMEHAVENVPYGSQGPVCHSWPMPWLLISLRSKGPGHQ